MKVLALYRPQSEHERKITDFQRDFKMRTGHEITLISLDTLDGDNTARLYDITVHPAILAVDDEGRMQKIWQGEDLPLINEVSFYTSTAAAGSGAL